MKNLIIFAFLALFCMSCDKEDFNIDNPDVKTFARQLKNGTYDKYEMSENGEKLWTIMPNFTKEHLPLLIELSKDTTLVCPCGHFPTNPISSLTPFRMNNDKACIMVGEYLLWCAEGIIESKTFASLTPILRNQNYREDERLEGKEILLVRKIYQEWWKEYEQTENANILPLEGTVYKWR